jgi:hypothetical protein
VRFLRGPSEEGCSQISFAPLPLFFSFSALPLSFLAAPWGSGVKLMAAVCTNGPLRTSSITGDYERNGQEFQRACMGPGGWDAALCFCGKMNIDTSYDTTITVRHTRLRTGNNFAFRPSLWNIQGIIGTLQTAFRING